MEAFRDSGNDPIVMVPVPRSQLQAVYKALASPAADDLPRSSSKLAEEAADKSATISEDRINVQGIPWTSSKVKRLEEELTHWIARELVTLVAQRAPRSVSFQEVMEETNNYPSELRGAGAALTKTTKRVFGMKSWPMSYRWNGTGRAVYSMDPKVATWWLDATGAQRGQAEQSGGASAAVLATDGQPGS